jgi:hypothetical protein
MTEQQRTDGDKEEWRHDRTYTQKNGDDDDDDDEEEDC